MGALGRGGTVNSIGGCDGSARMAGQECQRPVEVFSMARRSGAGERARIEVLSEEGVNSTGDR